MQTKNTKGVLSKKCWFLSYSPRFSNVSHQYIKTIVTSIKYQCFFVFHIVSINIMELK